MNLNDILKPGSEHAEGYVPVLLAPMAGITDIAFRRICVELGCDFTFTEMVSAKGVHYNNSRTRELLAISDIERPCGVQLFGHESEILAETARRILDETAGEHMIGVIDINMGCPAPKITSNGDGSALMRNPSLASKLISSVVKAVNVPVSVKFRKGWDDSNINAVEFARMAEESGASFLTIHGRTRTQMYSGQADREIIAKVVQAVKIPVIGNGDIFSAEGAIDMLKTGCSGLMIARGAQGNPFIFAELRAALDGRSYTPPTDSERLDMALLHIESFMENVMRTGRNPAVFVELRKHVAWYTRGMCGAAELRRQINACANCDDLIRLVQSFKESVSAAG